MSVFLKTPDPSSTTGSKRPRLGPPMLDSSSERDVSDSGSSYGSQRHLNTPLSDSFRANACSQLHVQNWQKQWKS